MNATFLRHTFVAFAAVLLTGSAVAAADPVLVLESHVAPGASYSLALESRALCVRVGIVVTDRAVALAAVRRCVGCHTEDYA